MIVMTNAMLMKIMLLMRRRRVDGGAAIPYTNPNDSKIEDETLVTYSMAGHYIEIPCQTQRYERTIMYYFSILLLNSDEESIFGAYIREWYADVIIDDWQIHVQLHGG